MNIFILSSNPIEAAIMQADCHVVKMPIEAWQMLAGQYPNHPCSKWIAPHNPYNRAWLYEHAIALCNEYNYRFGKTHAIEEKLREFHMPLLYAFLHEKVVQTAPLTMPYDCVYWEQGSTVASYRKYYIYKSRILSPSKFRYTKRLPPAFLSYAGFTNPI